MRPPQANENWSRIYCGGRDGSVWVVDLRQADSIRLLCREEAAVLRLLVLPDEQRLCVATTASHVNTYVSSSSSSAQGASRHLPHPASPKCV